MEELYAIGQESADVINALLNEVQKSYENIVQDASALLTVYQLNEEYLGIYRDNILEIAKTISSAVSDQDGTILELKLVLRQYSDIIQDYLNTMGSR